MFLHPSDCVFTRGASSARLQRFVLHCYQCFLTFLLSHQNRSIIEEYVYKGLLFTYFSKMKTFCWLLPRVQEQNLARPTVWNDTGPVKDDLRPFFDVWKLQLSSFSAVQVSNSPSRAAGFLIRRAESCYARMRTSDAIDDLIEDIEKICKAQELREAEAGAREEGEEGFLLRSRLQYSSDCETNDSLSVAGELYAPASPSVHLSFRKESSSAR
mmetsp:Transcript_10371/g.34593  ORF Transcript_10371/g.34593 Transcript_10371/m.34593 type:complete len:213 (-) Transcript_10371:557-1195(-)